MKRSNILTIITAIVLTLLFAITGHAQNSSKATGSTPTESEGFTGSIPTQLGQLSGNIPTQLGQFSGSIPTQLGNLVFMDSAGTIVGVTPVEENGTIRLPKFRTGSVYYAYLYWIKSQAPQSPLPSKLRLTLPGDRETHVVVRVETAFPKLKAKASFVPAGSMSLNAFVY